MKNHQITLSNFEEIIDSRILERGFEIYKNDQILSIEEIDKGLWEAIVSGTEEYNLTIHLQDNLITYSSCNCPYDMGICCKHEVAVFNFLKYSDLVKISGSNKMERIRNIVNDFSPEEIKDNLLDILKNNREARESFLEEYKSQSD